MKSLILLEQLNQLLQRKEEQKTSFAIEPVMNGADKSHSTVRHLKKRPMSMHVSRIIK